MRQPRNALPGLGNLATVVTAIVTASVAVWMVTFGAPSASLYVHAPAPAAVVMAQR
jgi:hypothetical protein